MYRIVVILTTLLAVSLVAEAQVVTSPGAAPTIMRRGPLPIAPTDMFDDHSGKGVIYLDGSWAPWMLIGVGLKASASYPSIVLQTGNSDASSEFAVYAANGNSLLRAGSGGA